MASIARFDSVAPSRGDGPRRRDVVADDPGLAAFRLAARAQCERSLSALIEREIIPRLMVAHTDDADVVVGRIEPLDIEALVPLALGVEAEALLAHVDAVLSRGVPVDHVMVDLLAPTARLLGEYWEDDRCDFVDVTMALWRLQEVVHVIAARAPARRVQAAGGHRALFVSMPGDQHNFGTVVVDELFRRDGWVTDRMSEVETPDLLRRIGGDWYDLVGLTVSCDCHIATLPSIIVALRNVSRNPHICVMVGGRIFAADPRLAVDVGADGTARDAKLALHVAAELIRVREGESLTSA